MFHWFEKTAPIRSKFNTLLGVHAILSGAASGAAIYAANAGAGNATLVTILAGTAFAGTLATVLTSKKLICDPYVNTVVRMEALAAGDLDSDIAYTDHADCVGRMTKAMVVFRENAEVVQRQAAQRQDATEASQRHVVEQLDKALTALAAGDLTSRSGEAFPPEYEQLRTNFNAAVDALGTAMGTVSRTAQAVREGAGEITIAANDLSRRTESQAAALEETSAALDEVSANVRTTADHARRAAQRAEDAHAASTQGSVLAEQTIAAMSKVQSSSQRIAGVLDLMEAISLQTNLLALNAGVEAARAGDAGRGFAVVANEVRALAQRSTQASQEIKTIIADSASEIGAGVELVNRTGAALKQIGGDVKTISGLFGEVAQSATQQASGLQQITTAIAEMNTMTQQNAAMVEETTAAAQNLSSEAGHLVHSTSFFKAPPVRTIDADGPRRSARAKPKLVAVGRTGGNEAGKADWSSF